MAAKPSSQTAASTCTKCRRKTPPLLLLLLPVSAALLLLLLHLHLTTSPDLIHQWRRDPTCIQRLRDAVTFLPLKDLRFAGKPLDGHTWFMSSTRDAHEDGEVQFQEFPSNASKARILCLKGRDTHDGSRNSYALAWPHALPPGAAFLRGLAFVSYNHYDYDNMWHGLSAAVPFVAWHIRSGGRCPYQDITLRPPPPQRWVLYHHGELRTRAGPWLSTLMEAAFGGPMSVERFDTVAGDGTAPAACFERAVVMRHNEGGMSRERRLQVYDFLRCKARVFCNVTSSSEEEGAPVIGMTLLMRNGARSFRDEAAVVGIFGKACREVAGCRLTVAYANNLTFCQQVKLMSVTDVLVSPHGAQLTNMFMMDRNSSVMEFFPKGWLNLAGIGQYVYHWLANWSGMNHRGAWRDPGGEPCPFPDNDRRCMSVYKNARIGHNETYFYEWAMNVLSDVKLRKGTSI
ncbi:uncharacterized protein LOC131026630 [Salvia miltiorrhiza]|uniref:uncharacterized protein LOC131026630 n=1 Tax=Salvia miltiorrhiza TaxID=226208 RepID=UPI0025AC500B|nr:uncharacterized protein LOC131026630 [Salvia miltiorrhiza]